MGLCIIGQEKSESNIKLLEEAKKVFGSVFFVPINSIRIGLTDKFSIFYRTTDLFKFKAVLPRISRSYHSYAYQLLSLFPPDTFMPIKPISFLLSQERFFLLTVLRKRGIPTLNLHLSRSTKAVEKVIENKEIYPVIIRTPEKKTGIVVKNKTEAKTVIDALTHLKKNILIEEVVKNMISVYVADPYVLASVKKKAKDIDIVFGEGEMKNQKINIETEQLALDAARAVEAQIARIDIFPGETPKIVNIDLNPDLIKPSKVTGINLTQKIIEAVAENYREHQKKPLLMKFLEDARSVVKDVLKGKQLL